MAEHGRDLVATGTLDVHEVGVGTLDESLELATPPLLRLGRVQQVLRKRHIYCRAQYRAITDGRL